MFKNIVNRFLRNLAGGERHPLTVDDLLADARDRLNRVTAIEARDAAARDAVLVDIRPSEQRHQDGEIPGAVLVPRNVLEWRLDPACLDRDPRLSRSGQRVIILCDAGYQSSLAAATARRFGIDATDLIGGFQAWRKAGLPVEGGNRADT